MISQRHGIDKFGQFVLIGGLFILFMMVVINRFGLVPALSLLLDSLGLLQFPLGFAVGVGFLSIPPINDVIRDEIQKAVRRLLPIGGMLNSFGGFVGSVAFDSAVRTEIQREVRRLLPADGLLSSFGGLSGSSNFNSVVRAEIQREVRNLLPIGGMLSSFGGPTGSANFNSVVRSEIQDAVHNAIRSSLSENEIRSILRAEVRAILQESH